MPSLPPWGAPSIRLQPRPRGMRCGTSTLVATPSGCAAPEPVWPITFSPAFAHAFREAQPSEAPVPVLTIDCWDRSATGVAPPAPPWGDDAFCRSGAIKGLAQGRLRITYDRWMRLLSVYDRQQARVFVQAASASDLPAWLRRSPCAP